MSTTAVLLLGASDSSSLPWRSRNSSSDMTSERLTSTEPSAGFGERDITGASGWTGEATVEMSICTQSEKEDVGEHQERTRRV